MRIEELIRRLREQLNARTISYNEYTEQLNALRAASEPDAVREATLVEQRSAVLAEIEVMRGRIEGLEREAAQDAAVARLQEQSAPVDVQRSGVQVGAEPNPVYRRDDLEVSYFRDLFNGGRGDEQARRRLVAAQETRAQTTTAGAGGEFAPPLWLIEDFVALARPGRITADLIGAQSLPAGVSSINIPKISVGSTVGVTQTQNTAITESNITTTSISSGIAEITGKQTVSLALLRQSGTSLDRIILSDLAEAYAVMLDQQVINGSAANGQLRGMITAGTTVTYTTTQPAVVSATAVNSFYMKILSAQSALAGTRYLPADTIVMHPRRWAWVLGALDSSNRPLVVPTGAGSNQVAASGALVPQGYAGEMLGTQVYVDPNIPTNRGTGTNQDVVFVLRRGDLQLWESSVETASFDATYANQNSILYRVLGFAAFIPHRHQASVQVIDGTGLVAPTFA